MSEESKIFTLEEANAMVPWLMEVTREAEDKVKIVHVNAGKSNAADGLLQEIIQHWAETVFKLGALPKQPFTVDFDSGNDYFCWEYPEEMINFRHGYQEGYVGRHRIEES